MTERSGQNIAGITQRYATEIIRKTGHTPEFISPHALRIRLPAFLDPIFDAQGERLIVCHLMKFLDMTTLYWPLPSKDKDEILLFYILNYEMNIHPSMYDESKKWPLIIDNKISYVKRSSRCYEIDVRQSEHSMPMVSSRSVEIHMDSKTRRPKAYPQWWKDENKFPEDGLKPQMKEVTKPSDGVVTSKRRIQFTDTDQNNHTNFAVYCRLCLDAFYENVSNRRYPNSSHVLLNGWIKSMNIAFKRETVLGDILNIDSWEDETFHNTFHFEISRDQTVATTASITLYSSLKDSHI